MSLQSPEEELSAPLRPGVERKSDKGAEEGYTVTEAFLTLGS